MFRLPSWSLGILLDLILSVFTCVSYAEARNSYRLDVRPSVCPSVRPSHAGIVSKRLNLSSNSLHGLVAP